MYYTQHYVIDWDKVKSLDDVKRLLQAIEITFQPNNPHVESIQDLVRLKDKRNTVVVHDASQSGPGRGV